MTLIFSLVLIVTSAKYDSPQLLHIGSFATQEQCHDAAKSASIPVLGHNLQGPSLTFLCVQASGTDTARR